MKPKVTKILDANQPWMPAYWVVDGNKAIPLSTFEDDSRRKYSAVKATAAILRAMRHDQ